MEVPTGGTFCGYFYEHRSETSTQPCGVILYLNVSPLHCCMMIDMLMSSIIIIMLFQYFVEAGAIAVRRVRKEDLRHVAKATGATVVGFLTSYSNLNLF